MIDDGRYPCQFCGNRVFAGRLTVISPSGKSAATGHEFWCRENIPAARRVESFAHALLELGATPNFVYHSLSEEDRQLLRG